MASAKAAMSDKPPAGRLLGPIFVPPAARAPFATKQAESRGRLYQEPESATRTCYQRDRDRVLHSTAFRRLKHKTQVFVQHEGDYYRTRMTHSLEVAQIARSVARVLALDEDLAEAVSLAHDLGHTPFGHAGEEALSAATSAFGGFDHNAHALRLVTKLEHRYADFDGLNLTWETLEGLIKHNGPIMPRVPAPIASFNARWRHRPPRWRTTLPTPITTSTTGCARACLASTIWRRRRSRAPWCATFRSVTGRWNPAASSANSSVH
jgi:dGTPase